MRSISRYGPVKLIVSGGGFHVEHTSRIFAERRGPGGRPDERGRSIGGAAGGPDGERRPGSQDQIRRRGNQPHGAGCQPVLRLCALQQQLQRSHEGVVHAGQSQRHHAPVQPLRDQRVQLRAPGQGPDLGVLVGVGTQTPEVIAQVEEEGWDVDFYAGCVYNRTRTPEEWKKALNGEILEMPGDIYLQSDPPRMYRVMRQTKKPCFAFKILAAGRIPDRGVDQAFRTAFESIKPTDAIYVGMFPRAKDEVKENAERVHRILTGA